MDIGTGVSTEINNSEHTHIYIYYILYIMCMYIYNICIHIILSQYSRTLVLTKNDYQYCWYFIQVDHAGF